MTSYYLDSSALVKQYIDEAGSGWIRSIFAEPNPSAVVVAQITMVEVASALSRRQRQGNITEQLRQHYESLFLADLDDCQTVPLDMQITKEAMSFCHRFTLKAYDSVQLATAVAVQEQLRAQGLPLLVFISSDRDLLAAASAPEFELHPIDPAANP